MATNLTTSTIFNITTSELVNITESISNDHESAEIFRLWLYGTASVVFISVVGLGAIMLIPMLYSHHVGLIQLLVGLAIGTLTGDALLHLLPHAFLGPHHHDSDSTESHQHDHSHPHSHDEIHESSLMDNPHTKSVIYGLMSLIGIVGFLIFERVLTIISDLCSQNSHKSAKIGSCSRSTRDKLSNHNLNNEKVAPELEKLTEPIKINDEKKETGDVGCKLNGNANTDIQLTTEQCHRETIVYQRADPAGSGFVVQLTDHHHHHHQQKQNKGKKSLIMMIVTGDGMHNFFDGLAIGVAFASSGVGGGLSTSVAILCHELPHEIGDFAVLLQAGLSTKRAIMYNTLSALLCFFGMTAGVLIGKMDTGFLSSIIAGMFLYIALVNMIPQLDCCPTQSGTTRAAKLSIQVVGISIGVAIMCIISIYEEGLQNMLK